MAAVAHAHRRDMRGIDELIEDWLAGERGRTKKELAELVGVDPSIPGRWIRREVYPSVQNQDRLAEVLGTDIDAVGDAVESARQQGPRREQEDDSYASSLEVATHYVRARSDLKRWVAAVNADLSLDPVVADVLRRLPEHVDPEDPDLVIVEDPGELAPDAYADEAARTSSLSASAGSGRSAETPNPAWSSAARVR